MEIQSNTNIGTSVDTTHTLDLSDKLYKVLMIALAGGAVFLAGQWFVNLQGLPQNAPHDINVSGEGRAYAKPDVAVVSFGAHTEAPKSQDAVAQNNKIMNAVIAAVKKLGVADKDIQTTSYNLQPLYDYGYPEPVPMNSARDSLSASAGVAYPAPAKGRVFRGYALDQQVQVKIRNFDNINAIMDAATSNGANMVGQLYFTVDDMEKVKSEAREKAIAQAKEKAKSIFSAGGLRGAKLVNISEGHGYIPYGMGGAVALEKAPDAAPAPRIEPGQQEINITVTLTYRAR